MLRREFIRQSIAGGTISSASSSRQQPSARTTPGIDGSEKPAINGTRTVGQSKYERLVSVSPTSDGGYIATTESWAWISKLDDAGRVVWQHAIDGIEVNRGNDIIPTADGGYLVAAQFVDGTPASLYKIDGNGNKQWGREYSAGTVDIGRADDAPTATAQSFVPASGNGYLFTGQGQHRLDENAREELPPRGRDLRLWVVRVDSAGREQWRYVDSAASPAVTDDGRWRGNDILAVGDDEYLVAGVTQLPGEKDGGVLLSLTGDGDVQWRQTYTSDRIQAGVKRILETDDGNYLLVGNEKLGSPWLVKVDDAGEEIWNRTVPSPWWTFVRDAVHLGAGRYLIAGSASYDAWVAVVDAEGRRQWSHWFAQTQLQRAVHGHISSDIHSLAPAADGGIAMAGERTVGEETRGWLVKLGGNTRFSNGLVDEATERLPLWSLFAGGAVLLELAGYAGYRALRSRTS